MNVLKSIIATAVTASVVVALGCSSHTSRNTSAAPRAAPEPVAAADTMPSPSAAQNERTPEVTAARQDSSMVATSPAATAATTSNMGAPANSTAFDTMQRGPRADRN
jgi:hypothetical protein